MSVGRTDELLDDIPRMEAEIESLRQRVARLERDVEYWRDTIRKELIEDYEKQIAALKARQPEGWKIVPVKATYEMREAGRLATQHEGIETSTWLRKTIYDAMLAAAPKPDE